ncbi:MAG: EAL domain-containing protein [Desulfobulbaceae bacterium]|nr:EAL domain-containing protein [Desulfobulbaceae bacterium]
MKTQFAKISRVTSLIAGVIALSISVLVPTGYFYVSRYYILGNMDAENELVASSISGIVATNPKTWNFEEIRVSEILHRRDQPDVDETRRVTDNKGGLVAEAVEEVPWPVVTKTHKIYDAGSVVASVQLDRSLRKVVQRTIIVAFLSSILGGMIFVVLRLIPLRAVRNAYGALSQSEIRYRSLYASMREGLALFEPVYDAGGGIEDFLLLDANPAFELIIEKSLDELIGSKGSSLLNGILLDYRADILSLMSTNATLNFEQEDKAADRHFAVNLFVPSPSTFAVLIEDITERKRTEEQIHRLAYYDHLTELPNRFLLLERLAQHLARASREGTSVALLFLDLDRFKHVNDTLGHAHGDQLLIEVGKRLSQDRRKCDTIARLGGDEFVFLVFCGKESEVGISQLAEKLLKKLSLPFTLADRQVFSGGSIGIASFPSDGNDCETLLKNADLAMYAAKESGRNKYCFYTPEMNSRAYARMEMDAKIRYALDHDEFFLVFQPVMDIISNQVSGAECLIRWRDSSGKMIMPSEFIPVAEESGLILAIGDWVVKEACRKLKFWADSGLPPVKISVNVSARQFGQHTFLDFLFSVVDLVGVDTRYLEVELTESSLMEDPEQVVNVLAKIRQRGISIAIDDFGTGYSSLSYLSRFPLNRLKVDRSFVNDVTTSSSDRAIVEAIFALSEKLGLKVVVEGVETAEQVAFLAPLGCQFIQGYYYHRPLEEASFLKLISAC